MTETYEDHADATTIHLGAYVDATDPGAVGAGKLWVDTSTGPPYALKMRNTGDTGWDDVGSTGGGGGGGFAITKIGHDAIGANQEAQAAVQVFKQVTLTEETTILAVEGYVVQAADAAEGPFQCGVYSDDSGVPGICLGMGAYIASGVLEQFPGPTWTARWLSLPLDKTLPAGTYWLMFQSSGVHLYYDDGGSDRKQSPAGVWTGDYLNTGSWSPSTTTHNYSIRATAVTTSSGGSGGSGTAIPKLYQIGLPAGATAAAFDWPVAPPDGHHLFVFTDSAGGSVTAMASTNTTWTQLLTHTTGGGSVYQLWHGAVSGGAGGTHVTLTKSGGSGQYCSLTAIDLDETLTGTVVSDYFADWGGTDLCPTLAGVTPGSLILAAFGPDNTGYVANSIIAVQGGAGGTANYCTVMQAWRAQSDLATAWYRIQGAGAALIAEIS